MASNREIVLCRYRYDPLDWLAATTPWSTSELQRFYCKSRLATEIQGQEKHSIFQHDDQLLAQQQSGGNTAQTTLLATDQQRSVLHAFNASPPQPIAYSPYGHRSADSGLLSLLGFNGERRDPLTGHYLLGNGYRAFNPVLMRFNSPDSLSPFGDGGLNPYTYCSGDPVNFRDPTGNSKLPYSLKYINAAQRYSTSKQKLIPRITRKTTSETSSNTLPENVLKDKLVAARKSAAEQAKSLINESSPLEHRLINEGKMHPFKKTDNLATTRQNYSNLLTKEKIRFGFNDIPAIEPAIIAIGTNGKKILITIHFDTTINYRRLSALNAAGDKHIQHAGTGLAMIQRMKYIRKHAHLVD